MWLFLLVAKSGVGFLQNLKNKEKSSTRKHEILKEIRGLKYNPSYQKYAIKYIEETIIYINQILCGPFWRQRNRSQLCLPSSPRVYMLSAFKRILESFLAIMYGQEPG